MKIVIAEISIEALRLGRVSVAPKTGPFDQLIHAPVCAEASISIKKKKNLNRSFVRQ